MVLSGVVGGVAAAPTLAQLRICTWNITNYNSDGTPPSNSRDASFATSFYGVIPPGLALAGQSMSPDVIIIQEMISAAGLTTLRNVLNSAPGSPGDWVAAPFLGGPDTQSAFLYRSSKVQYLATWTIALGSSSTCNQPRHTRRYDFRPVGYAAPGATIGAYSVHLKAQGSNSACPAGENAQGRRLIECQRIRDNAEGVDTNPAWVPGNGGTNPAGSSALPAGYLFMVAGDTNIQSSGAVDFQELVGTQANDDGRVFDPIATPGTWNNTSQYRIVHTQDPAATGQMDDRYDLILMSAGLIDSDGLSYMFVPGPGNSIPAYSTTTWNDPNHTYRCWGNDGGSFNMPLRTVGNTMVGQTIAEALRTSATGGGHLPIIADFRVPAKVGSVNSVSFGQVTQGSTAEQEVSIANAGNVALWSAEGIDALRYSLNATSVFSAPAGSFVDAAGGGANTHTISMDTSTPGMKSGVLIIASNDPDVPAKLVNLTGEVVPGTVNQPPVAHAGPDQVVNNQSGSGSELVTLDGSASTDDGTIQVYRWSEGSTILAIGTSPTPQVSLNVGVHTILLTCFDNGGLVGTDTVVVNVNARPTASAGDDQTVIDADGSGSETVMLSGDGSSDPDDGLSPTTGYRWSIGPTVVSESGSPALQLDLPVGVTTLTLRVTDTFGAFHDDDVQVTVEPGSPACAADFNQDGNLDPDDLGDFINCFFQMPPCPQADFNADGNVDPDDLGDFINAYFAGCG
ncbi:MAG: hypothetical protein AB7Q91_14890 [Phycisphaerales bacterium]